MTQILLVLFYIASSHAITQERTSLIVSELEHSSTHENHTQIDEGCRRLDGSIPNYQQANPKAIGIFNVEPCPLIGFLPYAAECLLPAQHHSTKTFCITDCVLDRAPPRKLTRSSQVHS